MELLWIFGIIALLGIAGAIYEQITEYFERERSKQRDEIAVNVLSELGITKDHKRALELQFSNVLESIPSKNEETEEYEIVTPAPIQTIRDNLCPKCGLGFMVSRRGQYGSFLGCTRYPQCKSTKPVGWVNAKAKAMQKRSKEQQKKQYSKQFMDDLMKAYR